MNDLPYDVVMYFALLLDAPDVLNLCKVNSRLNKIICNNQTYWMNKLLKEFPKPLNTISLISRDIDYKEYYRFLTYNTKIFSINIYQYNHEANQYENITGKASLTYHDNTDVISLLRKIFDDIFSQNYGKGLYTVSIDEEEYLDIDDILEKVDVHTGSIEINFGADSFIDETDESLSASLKEIIRKVKNL